MTVARLRLKVKVVCQGQMSLSSSYGCGNAETRSVRPRSSIEDSFSSYKVDLEETLLTKGGLFLTKVMHNLLFSTPAWLVATSRL